MTKIEGSGSISQRHGSADPDPPQNVMDPQHCYQDTEKARDESVYYALMFGLLGLGSTVATFLQGLMFGISGKTLLLGIFFSFPKNAVTIYGYSMIQNSQRCLGKANTVPVP
jgi:hypothetical protein